MSWKTKFKEDWEEDICEETVYIVAVNDGSHFQPTIYGKYETLESAKESVQKLLSRKTFYRNVIIYEAKEIVNLKK